MKSFLIFLSLGFFTITFSQSIKQQFEKSDFEELIKNKDNANHLTGEELYYVGYAFFRKEDDKNALEFYEKALNKGFKNPVIYFQKGLSEIYLNKFDDALRSYDVAIKQVPKAEFFIEKGRVYKLQHKPLEEIKIYIEGLEKSPKDKFYVDLVKLAGNFYYAETKDFKKAVEIYQMGILDFPVEYSFYEKIIKALNAQDRFTEANSYFEKMKDFYINNLLNEDEMSLKNLSVDEFEWKGQWVNVYKYFEEPKQTLEPLYTVYLINKTGEKIERKFNFERTIQIKNSDPQYVICEEINSGHATFPQGFRNQNFTLTDLRKSIIKILNNNQKPAAVIK